MGRPRAEDARQAALARVKLGRVKVGAADARDRGTHNVVDAAVHRPPDQRQQLGVGEIAHARPGRLEQRVRIDRVFVGILVLLDACASRRVRLRRMRAHGGHGAR